MQNNLLNNTDNKNLEYKVLARKYRPKMFCDIIAQHHIIKIIQNALKKNKIHHAYILTGTRGVGKTTIARILSKTLNCSKSKNNKLVLEPCLICENCILTEKSIHQDILEIDAASHTGIADIKEIIENSKYKPLISNYKVFIIDEVHMLSNSAFNALLKILEEPPKHVKFFLATTEILKIPLTVVSRCQKLDLHRLTIIELINYLQNILKKEGFCINQRSLILIAKAAQGSARDGLSMLDQAILVCKDSIIDLNSVTLMLGMIKTEYICDLFNTMLIGETKDALDIARDLYSKGAEPRIILNELIEVVYKISLCKISDEIHIISSDFELQKYYFISKKTSLASLIRFWQILSESFLKIEHSYNEMIYLEMTIIKTVYLNITITPEKILQSFNNNRCTANEQPCYLDNEDENCNFDKIEDLFDFLVQKMEMMLLHTIKNNLSIIEFKKGYIKVKIIKNGSIKKQDIEARLKDITGFDWIIEKCHTNKTVNYCAENEKKITIKKRAMLKNELVKTVFKSFSGIEIDAIQIPGNDKKNTRE